MSSPRIAAFALLASIAAACGATQSDRVELEIARLDETLKTVEAAAADLPKDVHPGFEVYRAALERAKNASSPEYRLYRLRDPFVGIETLAFLAKQKSSGTSVASFEQLWREHATRFEAKPPDARGTLLERALIERELAKLVR